MDKGVLIKKAFEARENAYVPYSNFKVGACILTKDGRYIPGANIENAAYGSTNCAERSAIFSAYSLGYRKEDIMAIAIVTKAASISSPCGACRQVLAELLEHDTLIILSNEKEVIETNMKELLPMDFSMESLK